jgi:hypothetical protein
MAGDIEAANGMHPKIINLKLEALVKEIRRIYPWSRLVLVGLTPTGSPSRFQAVRFVNAFMQHISDNERLLHYISNKDSKLRDNIHLTMTTKMTLCKSIASIITKPFLHAVRRFR